MADSSSMDGQVFLSESFLLEALVVLPGLGQVFFFGTGCDRFPTNSHR